MASDGQVYTAAATHSTLAGSGGADTLNASEAGDTLTGGAGADLFHFGVKPWEPVHITDFQLGADRLDLSSLLRAAGYTGSDPVADRYVSFADDGAGGTNVMFDRDGAAGGQPWPDRIIALDHLRYDPAAASQILAAPGAVPLPAPGAFVLFAGQSNMGGKGTSAQDVDAQWKPDPLTFIWQPIAHAWVQMQPGTNTGWSKGEEPSSWGPEVEFAIRFRAAHPDTPLYIVKDVHGGATLTSDWNPDNAGHLFDGTTALVAEAGGALGGRRPDALLWGQGEEDATTEAAAQAYQANLAKFFAAARSAWLGAADGKIGYFQISTAPPYAAVVRQAQANVDAADPNAASFDADFPLQGDHDHYTAQGLDQVGAGLFDAYARLSGGTSGAGGLQEGGAGADTLNGGPGADVIRGYAAADVLNGAGGPDEVNGNQGNDTVDGGAGADTVYGGQGDDLVYGGEGDDVHVNGNLGADTVRGGDGADTVFGGQGDDQVFGDAGDDWLSGDRGSDTLTGGAGADRFHLGVDGGRDIVTDFNGSEGDRVVLDHGAAYTVTQAGADTLVTLAGGEQLTLQGVEAARLAAGWIVVS